MADQKVQLKDNGNNLFPLSPLNGIDTSNIIATISISDSHRSDSYTCNQDCYVCPNGYTAGAAKLNGRSFGGAWQGSLIAYACKKGDVWTFGHNGSGGYGTYVFGVKR